MVDEEEVPAMHLEDSYEDNETVNQESEIDSEEIFILEPDLGSRKKQQLHRYWIIHSSFK